MGKRIYVMKIITYVFLILSIMVSLKRNAFEKHFLNEDGSITAVVYPQPVH